jgi:hypothetical protein
VTVNLASIIIKDEGRSARTVVLVGVVPRVDVRGDKGVLGFDEDRAAGIRALVSHLETYIAEGCHTRKISAGATDVK